eukprot:CAMPEP_0178488990 /NCGR_PEP_ID=MMETSP0696-20121128/10145_1 /TAXON_ID=265572 /ORGANISM="Extubocellulus spinifer, Strain CCMP396" /LENGTH=395 /DNA_ID=CAMNT_0020116777 /DNA_START=409 /DNA_END=1596 /DNA_ORIENTATION=-
MTVLKASRKRPVSTISLSDLDFSNNNSNKNNNPEHREEFVPHPNFRGLFAGSGSDCLSDGRIAKEILNLVPSSRRDGEGASAPNVLYLGTATYDLSAPRARQTDELKKLGCTITSLDVSDKSPSPSDLKGSIDAADIIIASGGNTLFAVDRWNRLNMIPLLRAASERGAVLTGGSAGAIWVFQSGHSDSADPETFRQHMLDSAEMDEKKRKGGPRGRNDEDDQDDEGHADESSAAPKSEEAAKDWKYIKVPGLSFLPGLLCPHHDMVQSNGVLRSDDFDGMLLRHRGERGIGIDHWCSLIVEGGRYRVVYHDDRPGSVVVDDATGETCFCPERTGHPGVWIKEVVDGVVEQWVCPPEGKVSDLLRFPSSELVEDSLELAECRCANPDVATDAPCD